MNKHTFDIVTRLSDRLTWKWGYFLILKSIFIVQQVRDTYNIYSVNPKTTNVINLGKKVSLFITALRYYSWTQIGKKIIT